MLMSFVVPRENKTDAVVEIIITAAIAQLLKQQNIIQSQRQPTSQLEVCAAFSRAHACIALSSCSTRLHGYLFLLLLHLKYNYHWRGALFAGVRK
jgi:hypothetical protein